MTLPSSVSIFDRKYIPVETGQLWQFKPAPGPRGQARIWSEERGNVSGAPDIWQLGVGAGKRVELTRAWQLFLAALNPNMPLERVSALLGDAVAFTNKTGFGDTPYQNWLTNENTNSNYPDGRPMLPSFDKVRTCSYACHTGRIEGNELVLNILDGNLSPPDISQVNPLTHPHLFFYASIVYVDQNGVERSRLPFQQSAPAWGHDRKVTVMPLVSNYQIRVPLSMVEKVDTYSLPYNP